MEPYTHTLVVVYYDTVAIPNDSGLTYGCKLHKTLRTLGPRSPVRLTSVQSNETDAGANQFQYGDYLGLTGAVPGFLFAAWTDRRSWRRRTNLAKRMRIPPIPERCGTDPILNGATITFNTTNEDKDDNTTLHVNVSGSYHSAASADGDFSHFDDNSSYTVQLQISPHIHQEPAAE